MENEKMDFSSLRGAYNKAYAKSDLKNEVNALQRQIEELQVKQGVLNSFIHVNSIFEHVKEHPFTRILSVECTKEWIEAGPVQDHHGTDEERYVFYIKTDTEDFSVLLEFLGEYDDLDKSVYQLHAPAMTKENLLLVEKAVFEQFNKKDIEHIFMTHEHATLDQLFVAHSSEAVCDEDFDVEDESRYGKFKKGFAFKKGEKYLVKKEHHWLYVRSEEGRYYKLILPKAAHYFPTV